MMQRSFLVLLALLFPLFALAQAPPPIEIVGGVIRGQTICTKEMRLAGTNDNCATIPQQKTLVVAQRACTADDVNASVPGCTLVGDLVNDNAGGSNVCSQLDVDAGRYGCVTVGTAIAEANGNALVFFAVPFRTFDQLRNYWCNQTPYPFTGVCTQEEINDGACDVGDLGNTVTLECSRKKWIGQVVFAPLGQINNALETEFQARQIPVPDTTGSQAE